MIGNVQVNEAGEDVLEGTVCRQTENKHSYNQPAGNSRPSKRTVYQHVDSDQQLIHDNHEHSDQILMIICFFLFRVPAS